jgi:hypothetical protein
MGLNPNTATISRQQGYRSVTYKIDAYPCPSPG